MSWFAEYIAWGIIVLVQLGTIGAATFCIGFYLENSSKTSVDGHALNPNTMLGAGIGFAIFACIFLLALYCGFSSLKLAIDVIDASADFLAKTKRMIAVPVFYFVLTIIIFSIWIFCMLAINSIGTIEASTAIVPQKKQVIRTDEQKKTVDALFLFMLFGIFWIVAFIKAKSSFITMVAATTYYFDSNSERDGVADVGLGFKFTYMYHAGSLAFGSFIIALIQFIRVIFMYLAQQAQKASGDNVAVRIIVGCANCCLKCLEKVVDYLNKSAYAYMAVSGDSFCTSAWNGFLLNVKHTLKFGWANFLAGMFIWTGKIAITILNVFSCYMIMKYITKDIGQISSPIIPLAVVGGITYITANIFLSLFDEAVLGLMTCLAVDMDLNNEPKYGPPTFHDALDGLHGDGAKKNAIADGGWDKEKVGNQIN